MMVVNDCRVKESATNDDAVVVINHEVPTTPTQKCLFACFYETLGVVSENKSMLIVVHMKMCLNSFIICRSRAIRCRSTH